MRLTTESAELATKYPMVAKTPSGLKTGVLRREEDRFVHLVEFPKGPGAMLMDEIADYLTAIDERVDDLLRGQKDAVLADMIGVHLVIEEAMTIRDHMGKVSEVTWSKVQVTPATIARTQAYALRQLDALAEKLESKSQMGDLAKAAEEARSKTQEWLAVLARCFQFQDAIAVLELDRVLDAAPDELDRHRLALRAARQNRLDLIARSTERLMARMEAAVSTANAKVLLHPTASREVVRSSNHVMVAVVDFEERLGTEGGRASLEARRWRDAATDAKDKALETGSDGVDAAKRFGGETLDRAKAASGKLSSRIAERALRPRAADEKRDEGV